MFAFFNLFADSLSVAPRALSVGLLLGNPLVPSSARMSALGGSPGADQGSGWELFEDSSNFAEHDLDRQEVQEAARTPASLGY